MGAGLDHMMLVAGDAAAWSARQTSDWERLALALTPAVQRAGARWLTIRPYGWTTAPSAATGTADRRIAFETAAGTQTGGGTCTVIVDPAADGREAFAAAADSVPATEALDDKHVIEALYAPADSEPDLIVICGPPDRLPPSLVWELAYGELVYSDAPLDHFGGADLERAISTYTTRTRRFGGL